MPPTDSILWPIAVMAGWTFLILLSLPLGRIADARAGRVRPKDFAYGEAKGSSDLPRLLARNYSNLFELPVLFYVITVIGLVSGPVYGWQLGLAWAFVALRIMHSLIHLFYNRVLVRLVVFAAGATVLIALWVVTFAGLSA